MQVAVRSDFSSQTPGNWFKCAPTSSRRPPMNRHLRRQLPIIIGGAGRGALRSRCWQCSILDIRVLNTLWRTYGLFPTERGKGPLWNGHQYRRSTRWRLCSGDRGLLFAGSVQRNSCVLISYGTFRWSMRPAATCSPVSRTKASGCSHQVSIRRILSRLSNAAAQLGGRRLRDTGATTPNSVPDWCALTSLRPEHPG